MYFLFMYIFIYIYIYKWREISYYNMIYIYIYLYIYMYYFIDHAYCLLNMIITLEHGNRGLDVRTPGCEDPHRGGVLMFVRIR